MKTTYLFCVPVVATLLVAACAHENTQTAQTPQYGYAESTVPAVGGDSAVERLASATCDRELACNNVGPHRDYETREACVSHYREKLISRLRPSECRNIDDRKLNSCVSSIQTERCGNFLDSVDRIATCTRASICLI